MTNQLKDENRIAYIATHINATNAAIEYAIFLILSIP